jgi:predicted glycoside hydrolase/deacetylase ChbG (UPF0249 family)
MRETTVATGIAMTVLLCLCCRASLQADEHDSQARRYLIIHADDAGMCHSENLGTIDAMENGIVSSASIMVPCPWFPEFAAWARENPDRDCGVHLTLNAEWKHYRWGPVAPREKVPSLVDEDGYLWADVAQVAEHVKVEEAAIELRAQIDRAKSFGVPITHLDTHMGAIVSRPDLVELYVTLALEYDLPILSVRKVDLQMAEEYPALAEGQKKMLDRLAQRGLPVLDHIAQFYGGSTYEQRKENYLRCLRTLPPGTSQLIIHCGYDDSELRAVTSSAARRDGDRRIFTDPEVIDEIDQREIAVITWKQFRERHH